MLILYVHNSDILVFTIDNNIYLNYKMKLPFYKQYQDVTFFLNPLDTHQNSGIGGLALNIVRTFNNNVLAILMK